MRRFTGKRPARIPPIEYEINPNQIGISRILLFFKFEDL
jgi:hypothetical protein